MDLPVRSAFVGGCSLLACGTGLLHWTGLSLGDAAWTAATTASCVGFGDVPISAVQRLICAVVACGGVAALGCLGRGIVDLIEGGESLRKRSVAALACAHVGLGTFLGRCFEGLSWAESAYLAVTTATTLGPGDVVPLSVPGRFAFASYSLLSAVAFGSFIAYFANAPIESARRKLLRSYGSVLTDDCLHHLADGDFVKSLSLSEDPTYITRAEFALLTLVQQRIVSRDDLVEAQKRFDTLDKDNSGVLDHNDILQDGKFNTEDDDDLLDDARDIIIAMKKNPDESRRLT